MRVVVADDATIVREGVVRLLVEAGVTVIAAVGDGGALLEAVRCEPPDLAIIDMGAPQAQSRAWGDLNNGTFSVGLAYHRVPVGTFEPVAVSYLIVNSGHHDPTAAQTILMGAAKQLTEKGADAAATEIGEGITALTGPVIGEVATPLLSSGLVALADYLVESVSSLLFGDCDGPVAMELATFTGRDLWLRTANGKVFTKSTDNQSHESKCGSPSDYVVNWSIAREG